VIEGVDEALYFHVLVYLWGFCFGGRISLQVDALFFEGKKVDFKKYTAKSPKTGK